MSKEQKELEKLTRGEINPELVAFGQALADAMGGLKFPPRHRIRVEVEFENQITVKMELSQPGLDVELLLDYEGKWHLMSANPYVEY